MMMMARSRAIQKLDATSSAQWVSQWEVPSLTSPHTYKVSQKQDGSFACDCPAWKFKPAPRPDCKHILRIKVSEPIDMTKTSRQAAEEFVRFAGRTSTSARTATAIEQQRDQAVAKMRRTPPTTIPIPQTAGPVFLLQTRRQITLED